MWSIQDARVFLLATAVVVALFIRRADVEHLEADAESTAMPSHHSM